MSLAVVQSSETSRPQWWGQGLQLETGPAWLQERRQSAWEQIQATGLPTVRDEEWRYLSLAKLYGTDFSVDATRQTTVSPEQVTPWRLGAAITWVFVDGVFNAALSLGGDVPHGLVFKRFDSALTQPSSVLKNSLAPESGLQRHPFAALNTASFTDGVVIEVASGVEVASPLQLLFVSTAGDRPRLIHPRLFVSLGANSSLNLVESYVGIDGARSFNNTVTELVLADGARLEHYKIQDETSASYHIGLTSVLQDRDSSLTLHTLSMGGALIRNNLDVALQGEGASATLNGLYVLADQQQCDTHLVVDHAKPHGNSHQLYKGILDGRSKGIFNGKVIVREGAVKTDATQINNNLILSREAEADPKPELEIYNNDVKCSHGATVGQLDEGSLFYLRSRGISELTARQILTLAFAQDVLERIKIPAVREFCEQHVQAKLGSDS